MADVKRQAGAGKAASGFAPEYCDFADRCLTAWLSRLEKEEAGDGIRTRDPYLGKVVLYQLSYSRTNYGPNGSRTRVFTLKE